METVPFYAALASATVLCVAIMSYTGLKGFTRWVEYKRAELGGGHGDAPMLPTTASRIEIADLKERLRKLEAIAAGVEL